MPHWVVVSLAIDLIRMCIGMGLAMLVLAPRDNNDPSGVLPRPIDPRAQMHFFMLCVALPEVVIIQLVISFVAYLAQRK